MANPFHKALAEQLPLVRPEPEAKGRTPAEGGRGAMPLVPTLSVGHAKRRDQTLAEGDRVAARSHAQPCLGRAWRAGLSALAAPCGRGVQGGVSPLAATRFCARRALRSCFDPVHRLEMLSKLGERFFKRAVLVIAGHFFGAT